MCAFTSIVVPSYQNDLVGRYLQLLLSGECEFLLLLLVCWLFICYRIHINVCHSFAVLMDPAPEMLHNTSACTCKCVSICY